MKLRCTENSIRIRLKKSEVAELAKAQQVAEKIHFGNQVVLTFALNINPSIQNVTATLLHNNLVVSLPKTMAEEWINSNQVGIEVTESVSATQRLHILIEKDFPCLDRENEDKSDTFWELAEKPDAC